VRDRRRAAARPGHGWHGGDAAAVGPSEEGRAQHVLQVRQPRGGGDELPAPAWLRLGGDHVRSLPRPHPAHEWAGPLTSR
jgi:hypothetical protein